MSFYSESSLEIVASDAYADEEMHGDAIHDALAELHYRGYSKDELYHFVTWGDN